jgi:Ca2+-binding EF-hand superfamily protein
MNRLILAAASAAMALGLATTATTASAAAGDRFAETMTVTDTNKDGMVSKEEFLAAMAKMYDDKMAAIKKMPAAEQAKMMKDDQMTQRGYRALLREFGGGR